jgi:hypothetical protein
MKENSGIPERKNSQLRIIKKQNEKLVYFATENTKIKKGINQMVTKLKEKQAEITAASLKAEKSQSELMSLKSHYKTEILAKISSATEIAQVQ